MNVEHSDIRACTQGVYSCFIKRLLRDYRQQHLQSSDSLLYICGHITEDYDQEMDSIPTFLVMREQIVPGSPAKNGLGTRLGMRMHCYNNYCTGQFLFPIIFANTTSLISYLF